jgi:chromosomal replication initiation ATPase DnaA
MRPNGYLLPPEVGHDPMDIVREVARGFNLDAGTLLAHNRRPHVCVARACAMAVIHEATPLSLSDIARFFGRDHTTVASNIRRVMGDETLRESIGLVVEELTLARRPKLFAVEDVG